VIAASALVSRRLLRAARGRPLPAAWPDVSVVCPLCGASDALADNLRALLAVAYDGRLDVVLVAADANDPCWPVLDAVEAGSPRTGRRIVAGTAPGWLPKTWSLARGLAEARFEHLVFVDADVRLDAAVLREVIAASRPPVASAAYAHPVVAEPTGAGGWLEAAVVNYTTLVVQPILARIDLDSLAGTLWAIRRPVLEAVGGFEAVRDNIADDMSLGRRLRAAGNRLALIGRPVVTVQGHMTIAAFVRHQLRWLRTWRRAAGATWPLALVFSSLMPACAGALLGGPWIAVVPLGVAEMALMGWTETELNGRPRLGGLSLVAPLALAAEQALALVALCGRSVTWGRYRFVLDSRGRIVRRTPLPSTA
jgi:ceramide glucosyltransferase